MWIQFGDYEPVLPDFMTIRVTKEFIYDYIDGRRFIVPIGFVSDGASIPDILEPLAGNNLQGSYVPAAFIHDWLCYMGLKGTPICSWSDAHKIFYQAMLDNGCKKWGFGGAWVKWKAVQIGMLFKRWKYKENEN